jgi:hypothetical protein
MANLTGPLLSIGAHGSFGPICFQKGRKRYRAISKPFPTQPDTFEQLVVRANFAQAHHVWNTLTDWEKYLWRRKLDNMGNRGKDNYMRIALERMLSGLRHPRQDDQGEEFPFPNKDDSYWINFVQPNPDNWASYANQYLLFAPVTANFITAPFPYTQALDVDGDTDHGATDTLAESFTPPSFTLRFVIYSVNKATTGRFVTWYATTGPIISAYHVPWWYAGNVNFRLETTTTYYFVYDADPPQNKWVTYCVEWDPPDLTMYRDGVVVSTNTTAGTCVPIDERATIGMDYYSGQGVQQPCEMPLANILLTDGVRPLLAQPWK